MPGSVWRSGSLPQPPVQTLVPFTSQLILFTYKTLRAKVVPTETHTIQPQRESGPTAPVVKMMARLAFILDLLSIPEQLGPSCL